MSDQSEQSVENEKVEEQSHESIYLDWNNAFEIIDSAFEKGLFVIIIGPKGTGKTTLVREYAMRKSKNLQSIVDYNVELLAGFFSDCLETYTIKS